MRTQSDHALNQKVARLVQLASRRNQSATITATGTQSTGLQVSIVNTALGTNLFSTSRLATVWLRANIQPS